MHEVSIALGMVDELIRIAKENKAKKIILIRLKIGKLSGIVTDSLIFAFEAIKPDYPLLSSAEIEIDEIPSVYRCNECIKVFEAESIYFPSCPHCESFDVEMISGDEQHIANIEVEV